MAIHPLPYIQEEQMAHVREVCTSQMEDFAPRAIYGVT